MHCESGLPRPNVRATRYGISKDHVLKASMPCSILVFSNRMTCRTG